jgi:hypothetical protein
MVPMRAFTRLEGVGEAHRFFCALAAALVAALAAALAAVASSRARFFASFAANAACALASRAAALSSCACDGGLVALGGAVTVGVPGFGGLLAGDGHEEPGSEGRLLGPAIKPAICSSSSPSLASLSLMKEEGCRPLPPPVRRPVLPSPTAVRGRCSATSNSLFPAAPPPPSVRRAAPVVGSLVDADALPRPTYTTSGLLGGVLSNLRTYRHRRNNVSSPRRTLGSPSDYPGRGATNRTEERGGGRGGAAASSSLLRQMTTSLAIARPYRVRGGVGCGLV